MTTFGFPIETLIIFFSVIGLSLFIDHRAHMRGKASGLLNASLWSAFWIGLAMLFYTYLLLRYENNAWANLYLSGYVLEKSLSVDNLMVFMAVFTAFGIRESKLQRNILYWGILGALVLRGLFVFIGVGLLNAAPWVGFIFALFIIWTGYKMLGMTSDEGETIPDYTDHWSVRFTKRFLPIYPSLAGQKLIIRQRAAQITHRRTQSTFAFNRTAPWLITPALLCLIVIEVSDIAFAFDSVPAVIAITQEPMLVYASMIFAVLGLRSLYFVLDALTDYLVHLEKAVVVLLFYIGAKMMLHSWSTVFGGEIIDIPPEANLWIVFGILGAGVVASAIFPNKAGKTANSPS